MHWGIDYGSKLAGTTVIAFDDEWGKIDFVQSVRNRDADNFCLDQLTALEPDVIFIDAPLSLPLVLRKPALQDKVERSEYFYRKCDQELSAMSPMFLGGLTARAMYLRTQFEKQDGVKVIETYPAALVRELHLKDKGYNKKQGKVEDFWPILAKELPLRTEKTPENWHQVDAILAWFSGWRYFKARAKSFGLSEEGVIWV